MKPAYMVLWRLIFYPAFLYTVFSLIFFYLYTHPRRNISGFTPSDFGSRFEAVRLTTSDGVELAGWYIPNKKSKKAVIVCHGYPMDKGNVFGMTSFLVRDFNVLLFDFRAMGESKGFFSTGGERELKDVDAAIAFLQGKGFKRAGLFGFSMGAAAILMSRNPAAAARVADAPFADIGEELNYVFSGYGAFRYPLVWLMKAWSRLVLGVNMDKVSPLRTITGLTVPALIIHGDADTQVPVEASRRLKAANPAIELWLVKGADHGETWAAGGLPYETKVVNFFIKNL